MVESTSSTSLPSLVDPIAFAQEPKLRGLIGNDTLIYANTVEKINRFMFSQKRTMAITDKAIYNINNKSVKRKIMIANLVGLTKTVPPSKCTNEFTVHVDKEYDYRYTTDFRDETIKVIKQVYIHLKKENLPIYHVQAKNLELYTTTEADYKKGKIKIPPANQRSYDEDLYKPASELQIQRKQSSQESLDFEDNHGEVEFPETKEQMADKKERRRQQILSDLLGHNMQESDDDSDLEEEDSYYSEEPRGTIDIKAKKHIEKEFDEQGIEPVKKVTVSSESVEPEDLDRHSFENITKQYKHATMLTPGGPNSPRKSPRGKSKSKSPKRMNDDPISLDGRPQKFDSLAPGARHPGFSMTEAHKNRGGSFMNQEDIRNSMNEFRDTRRSAMRSSPKNSKKAQFDSADRAFEQQEDMQDFFSEHLAKVSELSESDVKDSDAVKPAGIEISRIESQQEDAKEKTIEDTKVNVDIADQPKIAQKSIRVRNPKEKLPQEAPVEEKEVNQPETEQQIDDEGIQNDGVPKVESNEEVKKEIPDQEVQESIEEAKNEAPLQEEAKSEEVPQQKVEEAKQEQEAPEQPQQEMLGSHQTTSDSQIKKVSNASARSAKSTKSEIESIDLDAKAKQIFQSHNLVGEALMEPDQAKTVVTNFCLNDLHMTATSQDELAKEIWPIINGMGRGITDTELSSCLGYALESVKLQLEDEIKTESQQSPEQQKPEGNEPIEEKKENEPVEEQKQKPTEEKKRNTLDGGQSYGPDLLNNKGKAEFDRQSSTEPSIIRRNTKEMRKQGMTQDEISVAMEMADRRQTKIWFDRSKKGANLDEFEIVKSIGKGACGKVFLVQHQRTGKLYAMKAIRKDLVIDTDQLKNLYTEKNILETADNPFLINMDYVFQNEFRIYFLMKFIKGGMLFEHLQNKDGAFSEEQVKFFIVQVALGLGHLHQRGYIYRDLKPENILLGEDGYLLVCDFGIAKLLAGDEVAHTRIGTTEYMAPEILKGRSYGLNVDWWALGTLLYELLVGIPPFYHHSQHKMEKMIVSKKRKVPFENLPKMGIEISDNARDIITKLLSKDPVLRLGTKGDLDEILQHPWFADLNLDDIINKQVPSPYIPTVKSDEEIIADAIKSSIQQEADASVIEPGQRKKVKAKAEDFSGF